MLLAISNEIFIVEDQPSDYKGRGKDVIQSNLEIADY